jgi:hypothetical protein
MKKKFAVLATLALLSATITPAQAASNGYRYWGYFQAAPKASTWTAAMTGPTVDIADGSVEGWAFTFSSEAIPDPTSPSVLPDFQSICGKTRAVSGKKRIAIVIDFGAAYLAPTGEKPLKTVKRCITIDKKAQGIDVLGKVVRVRGDKSGLICGLGGYPRKECGVEIPTPSALANK